MLAARFLVRTSTSGIVGDGVGLGEAVEVDADAAGDADAAFAGVGLCADFGAGVGVYDDASAGFGVALTGAAGALPATSTARATSRHCPFTGKNCISKRTCIGTDGKKPANRITPFE